MSAIKANKQQIGLDILPSKNVVLSTNTSGELIVSQGNHDNIVSEMAKMGNQYLKVPSGTTAQRPSSPVEGMIRYNSDNQRIEGYDGGTWGGIRNDVVSVKDFGAVGDGVTDDTVAVHAFFDALAADGGVGYINKGTYICDPYSRDFASNPGVGFAVYGSGPMSTILKLKTHSNFLQWTNASGVHINGITVDCGYSTLPATGVYSHGITFSNCNDCSANNCHALDFSKTGFIAYTDSTATGTIYSRVFFRNCYAKCSAAKAAGLDTNGVLISDNWYSGIENCIAEDITTYGIELKQNARYCHITGCTAKNVTAAGFAMGQTTVGIDGCDFNTVTDFISVGCAIGAMIGEGENNLINGLMVDFTGMTSAQQNSAVRLENCKNNTILNLATQNLGSYGVLFYSDGNPISGNFVQISNLSMCRAEYYAAGFNAASANNSVIVSNITDASGAVVLGNTVRFSAGGTLNKFFYQNDPRFIVGASGASSNSNAKLVLESGANTIFNLLAPSATVSGLTFSNPSSSTDGYIHYDNANRRLDIGVEASATYFRFQKVQFVPVPDNAVSLGSGSARWSTVYAGTGTISTSDEREKTFLPIESAETLVAKELKSCIKKFKFNDAIQLKGDNARLHFGIGAQTVASVFQSHGLDPSKYAMFCYDEWEEERDEDGSVIRPAGNRYGIRYDELLAFIISAI